MKNKVSVVGLGYVGLPLLCLIAKKGYYACGIDIDSKKIESIKKGELPVKDPYVIKEFTNIKTKVKVSNDFSKVKDSDIIIFCIPTPIDKNKLPNLKPLESSLNSVSPYLKKDQLIIIESTVSPRTCRDLITPIMEKRGFDVGKDIFLAHCPERIDPGNKKWTIENIPRVIGAISKEGLEKAAKFYESILNSSIKKLSSIEAAEATKILENAFRDINIAFVNELAVVFDKLGIDILEVINGASTKPFGFMPHYPGCGVGGHCIPVDPYYIIEKAKSMGCDPKFMRLAREINNNMPEYLVQKVVEGLNDLKKSVKGTKISVLGVAYKRNVEDIRESPAFYIINRLRELKAELTVYDPYVPEESTVESIEKALESECIVIVTDHDEFKNIDFGKYKNIKLIVDGRNCLNKNKIKKSGIIYRGIGR